MHFSLLNFRTLTFSGLCLSFFFLEFGTLALRSQSFSFEFGTLALRDYEKSCAAVGVVKATVGVVDRHVLQKSPFMGLSHSLYEPDLVFSLFSTFEWQLASAETPRSRDLAIFMMTTTTTIEPITLPPCACAQGNSIMTHLTTSSVNANE